jgi:peptide/nickel transport system substrate-binding protein
LTLDRRSFIDTIAEGQGDINGAMQSPPAGLWGLPPEILATLPGYGPDIAANRAEARKLMEKHGYGPRPPACRQGCDAQHRTISRPGDHPDRSDERDLHRRRARRSRDGELVPKDRSQGLHGRRQPVRKRSGWSGRLFLRALRVRLGANYTNYCNPELEKMYEQQSIEADQTKRKQLVWEIDRRLQEDAARPMI